MTVNVTTSKVRVVGDGSTTVFSFSPMEIEAATEVSFTTVDEDGVETVISQGAGATNFSVAAATSFPGTGSITYPASGGTPLATGEFGIIALNLAQTQLGDLENQGGYFPEVQEALFDRAAKRDLMILEKVDRSPKFKIGEDLTGVDVQLPPPAANTVIGIWNSDATAIIAGPSASSISGAQAAATAAEAAQTEAEAAQTAAEAAETAAEAAQTAAEAAQAAVEQALGHKFQAFLSTDPVNITGNTTAYTVVCDTEIFDVGGRYNNSTGIFTAEYEGYYSFGGALRVQNITAAADVMRIELVTTDRTFRVLGMHNPVNALSGVLGEDFGFSWCVPCVYLDAGDTALFRITGFGEAGNVWDLIGSTGATYFTGHRLS